MARPRKCRRVCSMPVQNRFTPIGDVSPSGAEPLVMTVEEFETVRLIDFENLTQEECAQRMSVARPTVQRIYDGARKKLAAFLVEGRALRIEGGDYKLCSETERPCGARGCPRHSGCPRHGA